MCEVWGQMKYDPTHISNILKDAKKILLESDLNPGGLMRLTVSSIRMILYFSRISLEIEQAILKI